MKILFHSFGYEAGWTYQENLLPDACVEAGHEVLCVASYIGGLKTGKMGKVDTTNDPQFIHRLPVWFAKCVPVAVRLRKLVGFYDIMEKFKPDIIFVNALQTLNLRDIKKYKRKNPNVKVYINSHTDHYTSGTNPLSMLVLHKCFYRFLIHRYMGMAEKLFYISISCGRFMWDIYKVPKEKTEQMMLGGTVCSAKEVARARKEVIEELNIQENSIIFVQAGKMDAQKCLIESLKAFEKTKNRDFVLLLVGNIHESLKEDADKIISRDRRIKYLGWKKDKDLIKYLNAGDIYLQPGKVSAILMTALCSSCAIVARDFEDYQELVKGNGWLIKDPAQLGNIFMDISSHLGDINDMKKKSHQIASEMLEQSNLIKKFTC